MFNMNIEWGDQAAGKGYHRQRSQQPESKGIFGGLFGGKKEEDRHAGHVYYYTSSRPSAPARAQTISVLPKGVKMPSGDKPEVSYGADGSKYLVIPPKRSNSTSRQRQIILTSGHTTPTPKRKDSTASTRQHDVRPPRRSNSSARPTSPPVSGHRAAKVVGDPELVKQYENSQRNVARWVESVADSNSPRRPSTSRRTTTR